MTTTARPLARNQKWLHYCATCNEQVSVYPSGLFPAKARFHFNADGQRCPGTLQQTKNVPITGEVRHDS